MGYLTREQALEHLYQQLYGRIKDVFEPLIALELLIGNLYGQCAAIFPKMHSSG